MLTKEKRPTMRLTKALVEEYHNQRKHGLAMVLKL